MIKKKICMLGSFAVGKTSLVSRFVHSIFSDRYHTTIGVKIDKKEIELQGNQVQLMLWDIHGQDEYQKIQKSYLVGSSGYILVADGTRKSTIDEIYELNELAVSVVGVKPFVLLINKSDLEPEWEVTENLLTELKAKGWEVIKTSAKLGEGVEEAFELLSRKMISL